MINEATTERNLAWLADLEGATPQLNLDGGVMITLPPGPDRQVRR